MTENETLTIRCGNPNCQQLVKIRKPSKEGVYKLTCPHCQTQMKVNVRQDATTKQCPTPPIVPPVASSQPTTSKKATSNETSHTQMIHTDTAVMTSLGHLEQERRFRKNLIFELKIGTNLIGRADESRPSDISLTNDPLVSRQSLSLEVDRNEHGFFFRLTILNAANPIYHNGIEVNKGDQIYLNYGDSIQLGKTVLKFCK